MNTIERSGPHYFSEKKRPVHQLKVHFYRFVGEELGGKETFPDLVTFPDTTDEHGRMNPAWLERFTQENKRVGSQTPGKLVYDRQTATYRAVDPHSPIGKIAAIKDQASKASDHPESKKTAEREIRQDLVEVFNAYAGERFNGVRDIANGSDFRGVNLQYIRSRPLEGWRQDLVHARKDSSNPLLFERWNDAHSKITTPTNADKFLFKLSLSWHRLNKMSPSPLLPQRSRTYSNLKAISPIEKSLIYSTAGTWRKPT